MDTYEKKYKDANNKVAARFGTNVAKEIFTDLYESEDERMMHQLHSWMKEFGGAEEYTEKVYTWLKSLLERQGEQKPSDEDMKEALRTEYEKGRADAFAEMQKEWSEDDEKRLQSCINILKAKSLMGKVDTANTMWLKSLKQRIGGKL